MSNSKTSEGLALSEVEGLSACRGVASERNRVFGCLGRLLGFQPSSLPTFHSAILSALLAAGLLAAFAPRAEAVFATGGKVVTYTENSTNFTAHIFTNSANVMLTTNLTFLVAGPVEYLMAAGGGGGGSQAGGGGGAGGLLTGATNVTAGTFSVIVGKGGASGLDNDIGKNGSNSVFGTITAFGGGGGGSYGEVTPSGGSGGGGCNGATGGSAGGAGTSGQGYAGGNGTTDYCGGGGGGAGSVGTNAHTIANTGGAGGTGVQSTFASGVSTYYAGGGGGCGDYGHAGGAGGPGGGVKGGDNDTVGSPGTLGTGGGGGGRRGSSNTGADGGSGIVIIRYFKPPPKGTLFLLR